MWQIVVCEAPMKFQPMERSAITLFYKLSEWSEVLDTVRGIISAPVEPLSAW